MGARRRVRGRGPRASARGPGARRLHPTNEGPGPSRVRGPTPRPGSGGPRREPGDVGSHAGVGCGWPNVRRAGGTSTSTPISQPLCFQCRGAATVSALISGLLLLYSALSCSRSTGCFSPFLVSRNRKNGLISYYFVLWVQIFISI